MIRDNKYIDKAFAILDDYDNEIIENNKVKNDKVKDNKYKGYIASFGASVIISGITPTVLMYCDKSGDKIKVMKMIMKIVDSNFDLKNDNPWAYYNEKDKNKFKDRIQARKELTEAATALKLAIRTYPVKEENKKGGKND